MINAKSQKTLPSGIFVLAGLLLFSSCTPEDKVAENDHPQLHYLKWTEDTFKYDSLTYKINDLCERSNFDALAVALHWVERPINDSALLDKISKACSLLHARDRKFILDLDVRNDMDAFEERYPDTYTEIVRVYEADLDNEGNAVIEIPILRVEHWKKIRQRSVHRILYATAFEKLGEALLDPSSTNRLEEQIQIEPSDSATQIIINAGLENANKHVWIAASFKHVLPDLFSSAYDEYLDFIFEQVSDIPIDGIILDEFGIFTGVSPQKFPEALPYSNGMESLIQKEYGFSLKENLLSLFYAPTQYDSARMRLINTYYESLRKCMVEIEDRTFDNTKKYLGEDALLTGHPTWIVNKHVLHWEFLYNGLSWWQVKRDYAHTDEDTPLGIRTSLAHKLESDIFYNMFYSAGTRDIRTYFNDSWNSARLGGRTYYLGYEIPEPVALELKKADYLEQISAMEEQIEKLDRVQMAAPDSRIALIFGYQHASSWALTDPTDPAKNIRSVIELSEFLLSQGHLNDVIPNIELDENSFKTENGKVWYGTQDYDLILFVNPENSTTRTLEEIKGFVDAEIPIVTIGNCNYNAQGKDVNDRYEAIQSSSLKAYNSIVDFQNDFKEMQDLLPKRLTQTYFQSGTKLQDGSYIFVPEIEGFYQNTGNPLTVEVEIDGHQLQFAGEDFLFLKLNEVGAPERIAYGAKEQLLINGKEIN